MFADDLFILCGDTVSSVTLIDQLLKDFYSFSGLKPNLAKSSIFYARFSEDMKDLLHNILPISEASLPVKYLGVPLISTRLKSRDCLALKEKILHRIHGFPAKVLSTLWREGSANSVYSVQHSSVLEFHFHDSKRRRGFRV